MSPEFETLLVVGEREHHEKGAEFIADALGIKPVFIPSMARSINLQKDYIAYKKLQALIQEFKPDIVHTHAAKSGVLGRLAAKSMNTPVIVHTFHGHVFQSYFNSLKNNIFINIERYLGKKSDAIIAISEEQRNELVNDYKIATPDKFRMIPLGLDLEKFHTDQETKREKFRTEFGVKDDELVITITGRLVPVKNHNLFLKAISYLKQNSSTKFKAFIVGDGETRNALEEKAASLELKFTTERDCAHPHELVFTSWRRDIDFINAGSDIIALTSLNEGTPVSLIEALAAGKPIISSRVGGIETVVKENITGLLSDIGNMQHFCDNLLMLVNNTELRQQLAGKGVKYVLEKFSYQRLVRDMSQLYHELIAKKKHV
jgi:glycosyltransferase involved in cell wall biosynthesis